MDAEISEVEASVLGLAFLSFSVFGPAVGRCLGTKKKIILFSTQVHGQVREKRFLTLHIAIRIKILSRFLSFIVNFI